jgi:hypothetical protein
MPIPQHLFRPLAYDFGLDCYTIPEFQSVIGKAGIWEGDYALAAMLFHYHSQ